MEWRAAADASWEGATRRSRSQGLRSYSCQMEARPAARISRGFTDTSGRLAVRFPAHAAPLHTVGGDFPLSLFILAAWIMSDHSCRKNLFVKQA